MRSKKVEISIPWPLYESARAHCRDLGMNSIGRYIITALVVYLFMRRRDELLVELGNASEDDQDMMIEYFLSVPKKKTSFLEWIRRTRPLARELFHPPE